MKCEVIERDGSLVRYFYYRAVSGKRNSKAVMYGKVLLLSLQFVYLGGVYTFNCDVR